MQSPLGSYYADTAAAPPRRHSKLASRMPRRIVVGLAVLAALPGLGFTFAPQVSLGSQSPVEFGQGTATLAACDSSIVLALGTAWYQAGSIFRVSSVTLSNLDTTDAHCFGKTLTVTLLNSSGSALVVAPASGTSLSYTVSGTKSSDETRTITIDSGVNLDSTTVARVTVETS